MAFEFEPTLESLDGVPQQFQGLYIATNEGNGFIHHPQFKAHIHGLTSALDKERKTAKERATALAAWSALGERPEDVRIKLDELAEAVAKAGDSSKALERLRADLEQGYGKKLNAKDQEVAAMRATVERYLVDNEATTALVEAKGAVQLLLPHVKASARVIEENGHYVVRVVDKDGDPRGDGKGGFMSIKDLIAEMKASESFGRAFDGSGTTGGGRPSGGGKPVAGRMDRSEMSPIDKIKAGLAARK
jgi:hypothetical protein